MVLQGKRIILSCISERGGTEEGFEKKETWNGNKSPAIWFIKKGIRHSQ